MQESISYLKAYGIEKKQGNLLYKLLLLAITLSHISITI